MKGWCREELWGGEGGGIPFISNFVQYLHNGMVKLEGAKLGGMVS